VKIYTGDNLFELVVFMPTFRRPLLSSLSGGFNWKKEYKISIFDLLGFKIGSNYYIDKCLPMGCSISCKTFEHFSTFIHWLVCFKAGIFTTIFWVSIVKPKYYKIVVGPSVFSFAIGTPKRSQTPSN
jgi:hypothetical protein